MSGIRNLYIQVLLSVNNLGTCKPIIQLMSWNFFYLPALSWDRAFGSQSDWAMYGQEKSLGSRFYCLFTKHNQAQLLGSLWPFPHKADPAGFHRPIHTQKQSTKEEQNWYKGAAEIMKKVCKIIVLFFLYVFLCNSRKEAECNGF